MIRPIINRVDMFIRVMVGNRYTFRDVLRATQTPANVSVQPTTPIGSKPTGLNLGNPP
jgi:hypothetical protein